jgi:hypothetical protein
MKKKTNSFVQTDNINELKITMEEEISGEISYMQES